MITDYFTSEEQRRWQNNDAERIGREVAQRFLQYYTAEDMVVPFSVRVFKNPLEYTNSIEASLASARGLSFLDNWRHKIFMSSFFDCLINNANRLKMDLLKAQMTPTGDIFILRHPLRVHRNNAGKYHNINGGAVVWPDGYNEYYLYGTKIIDTDYKKLQNKQYSFNDFVREKNEEVKSVILKFFEEKYGSEDVYNFIRKKLKELDTYVNEKEEKYLQGTTKGMNVGVYTLFKGQIRQKWQILTFAFVRCYCPSTDRMFFLSVHPNNTNAKDAIASLYRIPKKLVNEIKYIQRQGERFSTVFTKKGKSIAENLTKIDLNDWGTITGDKYFKLMRYEY